MVKRDPFDMRSPFEALERARRERLVIAICRGAVPAGIPLVILFGLMLANTPSWQLGLTFGITALMIPATLGAQYLARRERSETGGYLLLFYLVFAVGMNGTLIPELFPAIAPSYITLVIMAGMMLGSVGGYVIAAAAALSWIAAFVIESTDLISGTLVNTTLSEIIYAAIVIVVLLFTAFMSQLAVRDLRRALNDATYDLVRTNRKLEEANRLKSQFMARTSHELRTPLNAIIGYTDLALRKAYGELNDMQAENLQRSLRNAKRLQVLINDILDLAKIEAGELELMANPVAISTLVDTLETTLGPVARQKKLEFQIKRSPDLPQTIMGDEKRLTQILVNLTDNAIKFTEKGSVTVRLEPKGTSHWHIAVEDTGRGIHESNLDGIFEDFQQVHGDQTGADLQGVGLGLSITRHLVKMMSGEIRVQSKIGKGSTFEVILPLQVPVPAKA